MNATRDYYLDKAAVVTGGTSGIGLALAETMLATERSGSSSGAATRQTWPGRPHGSTRPTPDRRSEFAATSPRKRMSSR